MSAPQDFYLAAFNATTTSVKNALFYPKLETTNFSDYSANAICRMPLSIAKNIFQFWARYSDISLNDLGSDIVFRFWFDASAGDDINGNPEQAYPLSLDFVKGAIVTWVDPSSVPLVDGTPVPTNLWTENGQSYNSTLPRDYLRYLAYKVFTNPNLEDIFSNETEVLNSIDTRARAAFDIRLDNLSSSNSNTRNYSWDNYEILLESFNRTTTKQPASENPSSTVFQQMQNKSPERFNTNANFELADVQSPLPKVGDASGAWYKMPFVDGDSIYFILAITDGSGQLDNFGSVIPVSTRKYRIRMLLVDDDLIDNPAVDGASQADVTYGIVGAYTKFSAGYSYTNIQSGTNKDDEAPKI
jgi:hypothetical protein